jgi:hypothetical protein
MNMPKMPHLPHLHVPHLRKGSLHAPKQLQDVAMPEFLTDLYRDLRNRRLLPLAGALVVGILAAPIVLASGGSSAPPPQASPAVKKSPFGAAVVAADHGIRELRKRGLGPVKDPFVQKHQVVNTAGSELGAGVASGPQTAVGSELGLSADDIGDVIGTGGGSDGSGSGGSSGDGISISGSGVTLTKGKIFAVNVSYGQKGSELQSKQDVGYVAYLPSESKPVFVYVGASQSGNRAFFVLSGAVSLSGDAACLLPVKPLGCQLIALKPGQSEDVVYVGDGKTYRLKLDAIKTVEGP